MSQVICALRETDFMTIEELSNHLIAECGIPCNSLRLRLLGKAGVWLNSGEGADLHRTDTVSEVVDRGDLLQCFPYEARRALRDINVAGDPDNTFGNHGDQEGLEAFLYPGFTPAPFRQWTSPWTDFEGGAFNDYNFLRRDPMRQYSATWEGRDEPVVVPHNAPRNWTSSQSCTRTGEEHPNYRQGRQQDARPSYR
jgi:hypothetical protein